ncbi:hypothetical protein FACS1894167_12180 [Synergistales bacterium]|nr:hypothetical protein FACS1894167_12180 [Synergistales bacterium]
MSIPTPEDDKAIERLFDLLAHYFRLRIEGGARFTRWADAANAQQKIINTAPKNIDAEALLTVFEAAYCRGHKDGQKIGLTR